MRSLRIALIVAAVVWLPTALGVRAAGAPAGARPAAGEASIQTGSDQEKLVGTYKLVTTEVKDANGTWRQTPNFDSIGYITYSDAGYMGVHVMPKNRTKFAANQPTPEEAQAALRGYSAYYGPYTVHEDENEKFVVHHRAGQINPGGQADAKRFYDFVGKSADSHAGARQRRERASHETHRVGAAAGCAALDRSAEVRGFSSSSVHGPLYRKRWPCRDAWAAERRPRRLLHHLHADRAYDGAPDGQGRTNGVRGSDAHPRGGAGGVWELRRVLRTVHRL